MMSELSVTRPRRISILKPLLLLGAVIAIPLIAFLFWVDRIAEHRWGAAQLRVRHLLAEARARDGKRPVLYGEGVEGEAWGEYSKTLEEASRAIRGGALSDLTYYIARTPEADPLKISAHHLTHALTLAHLTAGAHRLHGQYPFALEEGTRWDTRDLHSLVTTVAYLALSKARMSYESGRHGEALDLMLDVLQFARDLTANPTWRSEGCGSNTIRTTLREVRAWLAAGNVPRAELERLGLALERLDTGWPDVARCVLNDSIWMSHFLLNSKTVPEGWVDGSFGTRWRFAFSHRLIVSDFVERRIDLSQGLASVPAKPWDQVMKAYEEAFEEWKRYPNPLRRKGDVHRFVSRNMMNERLSELRLLRAEVSVRLTGSVPSLGDPFGGTLKHVSSGGVTKIWGVGPDGVDNGGVGEFSGNTKDAVIEVRK